MPHILMIATGGTIACCETAHGLSPALDSSALLGALPELSALCTVETLDLMQLDSTDVTAADRQRMAQAVWQNRRLCAHARHGYACVHRRAAHPPAAAFRQAARADRLHAADGRAGLGCAAQSAGCVPHCGRRTRRRVRRDERANSARQPRFQAAFD